MSTFGWIELALMGAFLGGTFEAKRKWPWALGAITAAMLLLLGAY